MIFETKQTITELTKLLFFYRFENNEVAQREPHNEYINQLESLIQDFELVDPIDVACCPEKIAQSRKKTTD